MTAKAKIKKDDGRVAITMRLPRDVQSEMSGIARDTGRKVWHVYLQAVREFLEAR